MKLQSFPTSRRRYLAEATPALRRLARRAARDVATADDYFQIACEAACKRAPAYDPARGSFVAFVHADARSAIRDARRREARRHAVERAVAERLAPKCVFDAPWPTDPRKAERLVRAAGIVSELQPTTNDSPEDQLRAREQAARISRAIETTLSNLRETDRALVRLCFWEEMSLARAAGVRGLSFARARLRLDKAIARQRRELRGVVGW